MPDIGDGEGFDGRVRGALLRLVRSEFDHEFRSELTKYLLKNPLDYPEEMRGWIPSHTEQSNMQLPISQVVGNFLTATTVDDLGGDIHGRTGMVRGGSTPYDFTQLTFDAVYGKWVSDHVVAVVQTDVVFSTTSGSYTDVTNACTAIYPYEAFDSVGLKPQVQLLCAIGNATGGQTGIATVQVTTVDEGGTSPAGTDASWSVSGTGAVAVHRDSGWQEIPSVTVRDRIFFEPRLKSSDGVSTADIFKATVLLRWVSQ